MSTLFFDRFLGDGARSNKYDVQMSIDGGDFDRMLSTLCQGTKLPSISTQIVEYKYKGKGIPIPLSYNYSQDWSCTFLLDENHEIKKFFESWIEMFGTRGQEITFTGKEYKPVILPNGSVFSSLTTTVNLIQYSFNTEITPYMNETKNVLAEYRLYNVFPTSVSELSYANDDDIFSISVDFKFSHLERVK